MAQLQTNHTAIPIDLAVEKAITVRYKNWHGQTALRSIIPIEVSWGSTEWHPHAQWLLKVWDIERGDYRQYALKDIIEFL
jgi:predicted DNA-binding transcriptional regulator YafY